MDFSLEWFMTIPGLLISGGVLLLLIALILLIVTGKKKKKGDKEPAAEQPAPAAPQAGVTTPQVEVAATPTTAPVTGAVPEMNSPAVSGGNIMDMPAPTVQQPQQPMDMNAVNMGMTSVNMSVPTANVPMDPMAQPTVQEMPAAAPTPGPVEVMSSVETTPAVTPMAAPAVDVMPSVEPTPVAPVVDAQPTPTVDVMPTIEPTVAPMPTITPSVQTTETLAQSPIFQNVPAVEPVTPVEAAAVNPAPQPVPQIQPTPVVEEKKAPVIYGGANPIVPEINIEEPKHQIYGGANPLENTQSIPISNLVGPQQTVAQTPTPEPTIVVPQQAPTNNQPINFGQ